MTRLFLRFISSSSSSASSASSSPLNKSTIQLNECQSDQILLVFIMNSKTGTLNLEIDSVSKKTVRIAVMACLIGLGMGLSSLLLYKLLTKAFHLSWFQWAFLFDPTPIGSSISLIFTTKMNQSDEESIESYTMIEKEFLDLLEQTLQPHVNIPVLVPPTYCVDEVGDVDNDDKNGLISLCDKNHNKSPLLQIKSSPDRHSIQSNSSLSQQNLMDVPISPQHRQRIQNILDRHCVNKPINNSSIHTTAHFHCSSSSSSSSPLWQCSIRGATGSLPRPSHTGIFCHYNALSLPTSLCSSPHTSVRSTCSITNQDVQPLRRRRSAGGDSALLETENDSLLDEGLMQFDIINWQLISVYKELGQFNVDFHSFMARQQHIMNSLLTSGEQIHNASVQWENLMSESIDNLIVDVQQEIEEIMMKHNLDFPYEKVTFQRQWFQNHFPEFSPEEIDCLENICIRSLNEESQ